MPTERTGVAVEQNPIRLKNLVRQAESELARSYMRVPEAQALLQPLWELLDSDVFWRHQSDGLALFLSEAGLRHYRVPLSFRELAVVAPRFHVKPLLTLLAEEERFYVLSLGRDGVRLYQATRHRMQAMGLEGVPASLAEAMQYDETERHVVSHPAGGRGSGRAGMFHGHGQREEVEKTALEQWFRHLDNAVQQRLASGNAPLLLAGSEELVGMYREANHYGQLMEPYVSGNPRDWNEQELHARCLQTMEPHFHRRQQEDTEVFHSLQGTGRASNDVREVVQAADGGRVASLFAALEDPVWGTYDPPTGQILVHETFQPGDQDLVDLAAVQTVLHDGIVHAVPLEHVPATTYRTPVAAILRY